MPTFNFDQVDEYVQSEGRINFLKLEDHNWSAKVRFMYGPSETFIGVVAHNISDNPQRPKYVPCIRELGQPLESCPLCKAGSGTAAQYYIPVYVESITKAINGVVQAEEPVGQVMIFQRGKTFQANLASIVRQSQNTPLISNVFNIVRSGKKGDTNTVYLTEFVSRDNKTLADFPERIEALGSSILPQLDYNKLTEIVQNRGKANSQVSPRGVAVNNFGNNGVPF